MQADRFDAEIEAHRDAQFARMFDALRAPIAPHQITEPATAYPSRVVRAVMSDHATTEDRLG